MHTTTPWYYTIGLSSSAQMPRTRQLLPTHHPEVWSRTARSPLTFPSRPMARAYCRKHTEVCPTTPSQVAHHFVENSGALRCNCYTKKWKMASKKNLTTRTVWMCVIEVDGTNPLVRKCVCGLLVVTGGTGRRRLAWWVPSRLTGYLFSVVDRISVNLFFGGGWVSWVWVTGVRWIGVSILWLPPWKFDRRMRWRNLLCSIVSCVVMGIVNNRGRLDRCHFIVLRKRQQASYTFRKFIFISTNSNLLWLSCGCLFEY